MKVSYESIHSKKSPWKTLRHLFEDALFYLQVRHLTVCTKQFRVSRIFRLNYLQITFWGVEIDDYFVAKLKFRTLYRISKRKDVPWFSMNLGTLFGGVNLYDPTIFDNLKVAFENQVYDLDNLDHKITITNRIDRMDFAILARDLAIQFTLVDQPDVTAEIVLGASLKDLAEEILELPEKSLGCSLLVRFNKHVQNVTTQCKKIEQALNVIWETEIQLTQTLSFVYEQEASSYRDIIEVKFKSKINEEHMGDISDFLDHVLETLEVLNGL